LEIVESIGAAGKSDSNRVKKYFRLQVNEREMTTWVNSPITSLGKVDCFFKMDLEMGRLTTTSPHFQLA